ncbi:hypothetical protein C8Q75DRAFT_784264, partial [Abortiporus biennis]
MSWFSGLVILLYSISSVLLRLYGTYRFLWALIATCIINRTSWTFMYIHFDRKHPTSVSFHPVL